MSITIRYPTLIARHPSSLFKPSGSQSGSRLSITYSTLTKLGHFGQPSSNALLRRNPTNINMDSFHHRSPQLGGHQVLTATPTIEEPEDKISEGNWTDVEKATLREAIEHFQGHPIRTLEEVQDLSDEEKKLPFKWSIVALYCQARGCRRNAKQCRERYINHMAPLRRDRIAPTEGEQIMHFVATHGKRWAWIGRELNRSENTLKNYWNQERKKGENGRRRNAPQSHPSRQAQTGRQHSLPPCSYPPTLREQPHSRRESLSSNPGLVSDHGSPIECSPRSSRHNSFAPVQQLPLPSFQGLKPAPASPIQPSYPMDRTQALSGSSAYSSHLQGDASSPAQEYFHHRAHPMFPQHSEGRHGFEHPSYTYGHTQAREAYYEHSYPHTAPHQSQTPSHSNLLYRSQLETLPPVSSLMNLTSDVYQSSKLPSVEARPGNAQRSSGTMDIRRILN